MLTVENYENTRLALYEEYMLSESRLAMMSLTSLWQGRLHRWKELIGATDKIHEILILELYNTGFLPVIRSTLP